LNPETARTNRQTAAEAASALEAASAMSEAVYRSVSRSPSK